MAVISRPRFLRPARLLTIALALVIVFTLYRIALYQNVARHLHLLAQSIPGCTGMHYSMLRIPFFSLQAHIHNVTLDFANGIDSITADHVHIRRFRPGNQFPRVLDTACEGIVFNAPHPLSPFGQGLRELGYAALRGDLHIHWERRGTAQDIWNMNLILKVAEAGEMALSLQLAKVNAEGVALALTQPYNWLMVLPAVELIALRGTYLDGGLFERAIRTSALSRGQAPDAFREALQHRLRVQQQRTEDPAVQSVWQSWEAFCRQPGRIHLRTNLAHPIPLGQLWWLRRPGDLIQRLALECRVE